MNEEPYPTFYGKYGPEGQAKAAADKIQAPQAGQEPNQPAAISSWSQLREHQKEQNPWGF